MRGARPSPQIQSVAAVVEAVERATVLVLAEDDQNASAVPLPQRTGTPSDSGPSTSPVRRSKNAAGQACDTPVDCEGLLACIDRVCVDPLPSAAPAAKRKASESCLRHSECDEGLFCIREVCALPYGLEGDHKAGEPCTVSTQCR